MSSDGAGETDGDEGAGGSSTMVMPLVAAPERRLESNLVQARRIDKGDRVPEGETSAGEPERVEEPLDTEVLCNLAIQRYSSSRSLIANLEASSQRNFSLFINAWAGPRRVLSCLAVSIPNRLCGFTKKLVRHINSKRRIFRLGRYCNRKKMAQSWL